jgi:hypothetical protein
MILRHFEGAAFQALGAAIPTVAVGVRPVLIFLFLK